MDSLTRYDIRQAEVHEDHTTTSDYSQRERLQVCSRRHTRDIMILLDPNQWRCSCTASKPVV
jgi:hypothetical protein